MDSDRAAPAGVVWSGSILFAPILANTNNLFQVCEVDCHIGPDKDSLCTYNCIYFLSQRLNHKFWVFEITASLRRFFCVPTTYVSGEKYEIIFQYTLLSGGLLAFCMTIHVVFYNVYPMNNILECIYYALLDGNQHMVILSCPSAH